MKKKISFTIDFGDSIKKEKHVYSFIMNKLGKYGIAVNNPIHNNELTDFEISDIKIES